MAKKITFDIELNVNGQNMVVRASQDVRELQKAVSTVKDGTRRAVDEFVAWGGVVTTIQGVTNGIQQLGGALLELANDYNAQEEAELKLQTVMRQRMKASDDDVDAIKRLASAQQEIGVVGDEVQLAGAQQVATFLNEKRSIEQLLPAMNNLAVQRKGLNVTAEDMVNIGNLVGKVMQGNVGALTRVGITFTEAEQKALKAGTEGERAAMLAKIITNNVGEMNAELAKTDAGHAKQLANSIGDLKEQAYHSLPIDQAGIIFLQDKSDSAAICPLLFANFEPSILTRYGRQATYSEPSGRTAPLQLFILRQKLSRHLRPAI